MNYKHSFEECHPDQWKLLQCKYCGRAGLKEEHMNVEIVYETLKVNNRYRVCVDDEMHLIEIIGGDQISAKFIKKLKCLNDEEKDVRDIIK